MCLQGILLVKSLIDEYSLEVVQAYMAHIQVIVMVDSPEVCCMLTKPTYYRYCVELSTIT